MNFHFSKLFRYENAYNCHPINKPFVSAVLFGFHGINLFKNLVSRELLRILENFHFSISISKHFDFTFHFSKKSESILISLCTSRKRVKAFFFHFALLEKEWKLFIFTFHFSNFKNPLSLVPVVWACAKQLVAHAHDKECRITCDKYQSIYLRQCFRPWDAHVQLAIDVRDKTFKANNSTRREVQKLLKHHTGSSKPCWQDWPKKEVEINLLKFILVHILNKHINAAWNR